MSLTGWGLPFPTLVRMLLVRIAQEGRFPFDLEVPKAKKKNKAEDP